MFSKLALLTLVAPLVSALTLHIPQEVRSRQTVTITWDTAPGDPERFSLELVNEAFNNQFAIANNIDPAQGEVTVLLPVVPVRGGYTLRAVNVGDINEVYSETGVFDVLELSSTFTTSSTASSTTGTTSGTGTVTTTGSTTASTTATTTSTSTSRSTTETSTGPNPSATSLNGNGADSLKFSSGVAVAAIAAGVAAFAL